MLFCVVAMTLTNQISAENKESKVTQSGQAISAEYGTQYVFQSKVMGDERSFMVRLPADYHDSNQKYPVLYLLDGENHFQHAVNAVSLLETHGRVPGLIVIGIPNNPGARFRDLAQQHAKFLNYMESELKPLVEAEYRTQGHNTLFGHSLAGVFALKALANNPTTFQNYISASPYFNPEDPFIETELLPLVRANKLYADNLYISMAGKAAEGQESLDGLNALSEVLKQGSKTTLAWEILQLDNQVHMTTPYLTIFQGLGFVFQDFQAPIFERYSAFTERGGMKAIESFYLERGKKYGVSPVLEVSMARTIATLMLDEKLTSEAEQILQLNIKNHPENLRAHFDLARFYQSIGDKKHALTAFRKALQVASPENEGFYQFIAGQVKQLESELK